MTEKFLKARLVNKHDIEEHWKLATGFCPKQGELIIYDDRYTDAEGNEVIVADRVRFKIGNGVNNVNDLPFIGGDSASGDSILDLSEYQTKTDAAKQDIAILAESQIYTDSAIETAKADATNKDAVVLAESKSYTDQVIETLKADSAARDIAVLAESQAYVDNLFANIANGDEVAY